MGHKGLFDNGLFELVSFTRVTFRDIQLLDMHSNNRKTIVQSLHIGLPCCQYCLYRCFTLHQTTLYQNPLPHFEVSFGWQSQNVT